MSNDLTKYLNSSLSPGNSPGSSKKHLSPDSLKFKRRIRSNGASQRLLMSTRIPTKSSLKLSSETKSIAINLNKHKLDEEENNLRPKYLTQKLPEQLNKLHKQECNCEISEIPYRLYSSIMIGSYKIYLSCRYAASNLPNLIRYNITAVLSLGEEPNHYTSIKGGYYKINHDGSLIRTLNLASRFLLSQLNSGNVLIHCDTGNNLSGIIAMAFLLKEVKITYKNLYDLMKEIRPFFHISPDEEKFIKSYDTIKAGVIN